MTPPSASRRRLIVAFCATLLVPALRTAAQDLEVSEGMPSDSVMLGKTPFTIQGFGDWNYLAVAPEGKHGSFSNGAFDLFVTSRLSDRWSVVAELVFEASDNELSTDLERFQVTYDFSDAFRVTAGRLHSPILRWAVTNHHGLFMETPVDNPIIARWEDRPGLWPLHFVGLLASGQLPGALGFRYAAGVGNGRGTKLDEVQVGHDANGSKAWVLSLGIAPDRLPGLQLFTSGYLDRIPAPGGEIREQDVTGSAAYLRGPVELRAEWSLLHHTPEGGGATWNTHGWYALASYRLPGRLQVRPYVLVEGLRVARGEAFLEGVPDEDAVVGGVRVDVNRWVALKGEYRSEIIGDGKRDGVVRFQVAANF